jgi:hypothetical protein
MPGMMHWALFKIRLTLFVRKPSWLNSCHMLIGLKRLEDVYHIAGDDLIQVQDTCQISTGFERIDVSRETILGQNLAFGSF